MDIWSDLCSRSGRTEAGVAELLMSDSIHIAVCSVEASVRSPPDDVCFLSLQLMPYLVMDILGDYPGLPGLFVAAVYSGSLRLILS